MHAICAFAFIFYKIKHIWLLFIAKFLNTFYVMFFLIDFFNDLKSLYSNQYFIFK